MADHNLMLLPHSAPIDLTTWCGRCGLEVTGYIREAFADLPPYLYFPAVWGEGGDGWGGPQPADPAMIYLVLPLDAEGVNGCAFGVSLADVVAYEIESCMAGTTYEPEPTLLALAVRLRELADCLETGKLPGSAP